MSFQPLKELSFSGVSVIGIPIRRTASAMDLMFSSSLHSGILDMRPHQQCRHLTALGSMATLSCWRESRLVLLRSVAHPPVHVFLLLTMKTGAAQVIGSPCCTSCVMVGLLATEWSIWIYDKVAVGKIVFQAF
jgi:hypothetical protein